MGITMLFQLINLTILLLLIGGTAYCLVVIVKAAKKVIKVSDIYLAEYEKNKKTD